MSLGVSLFIIIITLINIVGAIWLLMWTAKNRPEEDKKETTGHVWDHDLREYNNPLPRWWLWLFYITVVFAVIYLLLYPGFGHFSGALNWTQEKRYDSEVEQANERYADIFEVFMAQDIPQLAKDPAALKTGERLFVNHCAACHGSDARGAPGFPNLRDDIWQYGGTPEAIKTSIANGRSGIMPPMGAALNERGVETVIAYIRSFNGQIYNSELTLEGKRNFASLCAVCHGQNAEGNPLLGAPNLRDNNWLYGGSDSTLHESIMQGRNGVMPAHKDLLTLEKIHVLTAYVYSFKNRN